MLDYAKAHPNDPRIPEALHWIVHASHFGGSHNESGRRAFQLLHLRYPHSIWARRTKVYTE
jgi:TolA-binding protein